MESWDGEPTTWGSGSLAGDRRVLIVRWTELRAPEYLRSFLTGSMLVLSDELSRGLELALELDEPDEAVVRFLRRSGMPSVSFSQCALTDEIISLYCLLSLS